MIYVFANHSSNTLTEAPTVEPTIEPTVEPTPENIQVLRWDMRELEELAQHPESSGYKEIINRADYLMTIENPIYVTGKTQTVSGNKHNYESIGHYYWPNPNDPDGPWISKDGQVNPDSKSAAYDYDRLVIFSGMCQKYSQAYYFTRDEKYYDALCNQLNLWFINSDTYMYPNMNYCQYCPGYNPIQGGTMIDANAFITPIDSFLLVDSIKPIPFKQNLINWFNQFITWILDSPIGTKTHNRENNHAIFYDLILLDFAAFTGNTSIINQAVNLFVEDIKKRITSNGEMPWELRRTNAWSYSIEALRLCVEFCEIAHNIGKTLPQETKLKIQNSAYYLQQFIDHQEDFPYEQISNNWNTEQQKLQQYIARLIKLGMPPVAPADSNNPVNPNDIKLGEIGGYVMYDKSKGAVINGQFVQQLRDLDIKILYINTPRKTAEDIVTYQEWYEIFELFRDSGIKLMLYIYEAESLNPLWTEEQIKSISNHPSFYSWIAMDEVRYDKYNTTEAWIKVHHGQTWPDGSRKWPNINICFLPKTSRQPSSSIGETYTDYLERWSDAIDIAFSDMYPIVDPDFESVKTPEKLQSNGIHAWRDTEKPPYWFEFLEKHCEFTQNHPELVHRQYFQTCKHIRLHNDVPSLFRGKPTLLTLKLQAYANLMSGSNGLMFFLLSDIPAYDNNGNLYVGFVDSPFDETFKPNTATKNGALGAYQIAKSLLRDNQFRNYKSLIVNLLVTDLAWNGKQNINSKFNNFIQEIPTLATDDFVLLSLATNNEFDYCTILNVTLENHPMTITIKAGNKILDLEDLSSTTLTIDTTYTIQPGEIICVKRESN